MLIDKLSWSAVNPQINFKPTKKKYYGKYLYKVEVRIVSAYLAKGKYNEELFKKITDRQIISAKTGTWFPGDNWSATLINEGINLPFIKHLNSLTSRRDIRVTASSMKAIIYSNDSDELLDLVKPFGDNISSIFSPSSSDALNSLNENCIIRNTPSEYQYKIVFRSGDYQVDAKESLKSVFRTLSDSNQIAVPNFVTHQLSKNGRYCYNMHILANSLDVELLINIAAPGNIINTHKLETSIR